LAFATTMRVSLGIAALASLGKTSASLADQRH
jgi:hypothetical protein